MKQNLIMALMCVMLFSCKTKKDISYMQDIEQLATEVSVQNRQSAIQPGDELSVWVSAKDLDVVRPFNQNWSSGQAVQNSVASGNTIEQPTGTPAPRYVVDAAGDITFPVLGKVPAAGRSLEDLMLDLQDRLRRYIKDPVVQVKNTNYKVIVLGEVNRPGTYVIPDGNVTVLSALGLAGDLTIYGKREDVLLVRNINGEITRTRLDLTRSDFITSPYYYLKQNDVLYVSPNETKGKTARLDPNVGIYISVASIAVTILALLFK